MRNEIFGTHYELGYNGGESIAKIAAKVADLTEKAIVDEIVRAARAAGVTDLYLMDRDFLLSAIQEKQERMNSQVNDGKISSMSNEELIAELRYRAQGLDFGTRWMVLEAARRLANEVLPRQEAEKNEPLTLDELRQMDGDKIYIQYIGPCEGFFKDEYAPYYGQNEQYVQKSNGTLQACGLPLKHYGKTWTAYRHKPQEVEHEASDSST